MMLTTLLSTLWSFACGEVDVGGGDAGDSVSDGGSPPGDGGADSGSDGGGRGGDGGLEVGDGGGAGSDGGSAPGYGDCVGVTASLDGYQVELYPYVILTRRVVEPAKGEDCNSSVWAYSPSGQMSLAVHLEAASVEALDGAEGQLDAAIGVDPTVSSWFQTVSVDNPSHSPKGAPLLKEHPEVERFYVDGSVTWTESDAQTSRLSFPSLCWLTDPYTGSLELDCQSFHDAWIELTCEYAATEAGPVGVSSWVTGPSGATLCVQPE